MALSLSLGEPYPLRFGPLLVLLFNGLPANPAKTQIGDPKDNDGNVDGTRGRRVARDDSVSWRIAGVGSQPVSLPNADMYQSQGKARRTQYSPPPVANVSQLTEQGFPVLLGHRLDCAELVEQMQRRCAGRSWPSCPPTPSGEIK
tara:strand:+ start:146 stop:580 length:435 start_codon:yes stop_codon:yes gene_type:complete